MANWVDYATVSSTGATTMSVSQPVTNKSRLFTHYELYSRSTGPDLYVRNDGSAAAGNADENATVKAGEAIMFDYCASVSVRAASGSGHKVELRGVRGPR